MAIVIYASKPYRTSYAYACSRAYIRTQTKYIKVDFDVGFGYKSFTGGSKNCHAAKVHGTRKPVVWTLVRKCAIVYEAGRRLHP